MTSDLLNALQLAERLAEEVDRRERTTRSNAALELLQAVRAARVTCEDFAIKKDLAEQEAARLKERCAACGK